MSTIVVTILFRNGQDGVDVFTEITGAPQSASSSDLAGMQRLFERVVGRALACAARLAGPQGQIISHSIVVLP